MAKPYISFTSNKEPMTWKYNLSRNLNQEEYCDLVKALYFEFGIEQVKNNHNGYSESMPMLSWNMVSPSNITIDRIRMSMVGQELRIKFTFWRILMVVPLFITLISFLVLGLTGLFIGLIISVAACGFFLLLTFFFLGLDKSKINSIIEKHQNKI